VKRILVPIDFSPDSLAALAYARALAVRTGAELLLLHVVDQTYLAGAPELSLANPAFAQFLNEEWRTAREQTERLGAALRQLRCRSMVKRGAPWQVIVDTAKRSGADLIVMATHGRTGLAHVLIGSVAERVVRHAHCAVLTVRRGGPLRAARQARPLPAKRTRRPPPPRTTAPKS
jgi:universal stress protein A